MGIWDFLTADYATRQQRTRDLNDRLGELLSYYLGPTGIPDRLSSANALLNPIGQIGEAGANTVVAFDPKRSRQERMQAALNAGLGTITAAAPAIGGAIAGQPARRALMETLVGASDQVDDATARLAADIQARGGVLAADATGLGRGLLARDPEMIGEVFQPSGMARGLSADAIDTSPADPVTQRGILAYHGSPHDFDRFSMDKIGTGEGAQAYGHGLYFAENEGVARGYRDQLSRPYYATEDGANIAEKYGADVADIFERSGGDPQDIKDSISRIRAIVNRNLDDFGVSDVSQLKPQFYGDLASATIEFANRADKLEELINSGDVKWFDPGRMYEVNIRANPEDFLDWDKPLSEQPQNVQDAFKPRIEELRRLGASIGKDPDGATLEQIAHPTVQIDDVDWNRGLRQQAADFMREAGIPGIKYLDAGSRYTLENLPDNIITREARQFLDEANGDPSKALSLFRQSNPVERWAQSERGEVEKVIKSAKKTATRNYVVFDENLIDIVKKYGIAGAAAMLGVSTMDVEQAMAQEMQPQGLLSGVE